MATDREACNMKTDLQKMGECVISLQTQELMYTCQCTLDYVSRVVCDTETSKSETFMNLMQGYVCQGMKTLQWEQEKEKEQITAVSHPYAENNFIHFHFTSTVEK